MTVAQPARNDTQRVLLVAVAALAAGIVGGIAWGLLVRWTGYEVGVAAWGIGLLVGAVVAWAAQGRRSVQFQVISVVCAVLGVLLGKYLEVAWLEDINGVRLGVFSSDAWTYFTDTGNDLGIWSWFDAIWFAAAIYSAYRLPSRMHVNEPHPPPGQQAPDMTWANPPPPATDPTPPPPAEQPPPPGDQNRN